jgi:hypothetical protein
MRYFMYSPLELTEREAFELSKPHLRSETIVRVMPSGYWLYSIEPGVRPTADFDTFLVRVEPDDSLRVVHSSFT